MQILNVLSKYLQRKPSKTTELQQEFAAEGRVAEGGVCYSLLKSWEHKFQKIL
jgi:hypothetical protein